MLKLYQNLGGNSLIYNESEDIYYIQHGADSVRVPLGRGVIDILGFGTLGGGFDGSNVRLAFPENKVQMYFFGCMTTTNPAGMWIKNFENCNAEEIKMSGYQNSVKPFVYKITPTGSAAPVLNFSAHGGGLGYCIFRIVPGK